MDNILAGGPARSRGRFITVEGIDGAGKSTHVVALVERLRNKGATVLATREPGGTPLAESLRALLLDSAMDSLSETLLVFAARRDHLVQLIEPALARGETVVCDRFTDATFAYQGGGRGFDVTVLRQLEDWVHGGLQPDLTFWFDLPAETAAKRRGGARAPDRFEQQDAAFFARVRAAYARRCDESAGRFVRIDAAPQQPAVWAQIASALDDRGW